MARVLIEFDTPVVRHIDVIKALKMETPLQPAF
jgi:hypothetical protein